LGGKTMKRHEYKFIAIYAAACLVFAYYVATTGFSAGRAAAASTLSAPPSGCAYALDNIRVVDGDTFQADILLPWGVTLRQQKIRSLGYDAWESNKKRRSVNVTDAEVVKGKVAAAAVRKLFTTARVSCSPGKRDRDRYGRILATILVDGKPLAEWMRQRHFLRTE